MIVKMWQTKKEFDFPMESGIVIKFSATDFLVTIDNQVWIPVHPDAPMELAITHASWIETNPDLFTQI